MVYGKLLSVDLVLERVVLDNGVGDGLAISVVGATITLNGNPAVLSDLQAGDKVKLHNDPVTLCEANRF